MFFAFLIDFPLESKTIASSSSAFLCFFVLDLQTFLFDFFGVTLLLGLDLVGDFLCLTDFFLGVLFFLTGEAFLGDLTGLLDFFGEALFFLIELF